jgi:hypothetical protein
MTHLNPANLDRAFAILVEAAIAGARCPATAGPNKLPFLRSAHVSALAHAGRIRVQTSGHNWRQITILKGPHAGTKTAANPDPHATIYITMDRRGTRRAGKLLDNGAGRRMRPSLPRPLSAAELRR